jgi:uncharacterized protein Usg
MTNEMEMRLRGYPCLLQKFIWQHYDLAPDFPEMTTFLKFWKEKIEGPLHSVRYVHWKLISPTEWRALKGDLILH